MSPAGRPEIGHPINVRLGTDLLVRVDAAAINWATSRANAIRRLLDYALTSEFDGGNGPLLSCSCGRRYGRMRSHRDDCTLGSGGLR